MKAILTINVTGMAELMSAIHNINVQVTRVDIVELTTADILPIKEYVDEATPGPAISISEPIDKGPGGQRVDYIILDDVTTNQVKGTGKYRLVCQGCGEEFMAKYATTKCCSSKCYPKYYKAIRGREIKIYSPVEELESAIPVKEDIVLDLSNSRDIIECPVCGFEFRPKTSASKYCSPKCSRIGKLIEQKKTNK